MGLAWPVLWHSSNATHEAGVGVVVGPGLRVRGEPGSGGLRAVPASTAHASFSGISRDPRGAQGVGGSQPSWGSPTQHSRHVG